MMKEIKSTRDAYGKTLVDLGSQMENLVVLDADVSSSTRLSEFARHFPDKYVNMGVAEQDMILTAAGMALAGKNVFASSLASFLAGRAYDQIRTAIAWPALPVRLVATHGGVTVGEDGATHQMLEDIALMRALPNMSVFVPADAVAADVLIRKAAAMSGPVYIRLGRMEVPPVYQEGDGNFSSGGGRLLMEGESVTICACGIMVSEALKAARILSQQDIIAEVIDCYSISPLPEKVILASLRRTGCCVVAEEHSSSGGLGEAIASLASANYPVPVKFISVDNRFGQSGTPRELKEYYGLTFQQIVSAAVQAWTMRRR